MSTYLVDFPNNRKIRGTYSSRNANIQSNSGFYRFLTRLSSPSNFAITMRCDSFNMEYSFYQVNNTNNKLVYTCSDNNIEKTLLIPPGNYTKFDFFLLLNKLQSDFICSYYPDVNNKCILAPSNDENQIKISSNSSSMLRLLGLLRNIEDLDQFRSIIFAKEIIDVSPIKSINIYIMNSQGNDFFHTVDTHKRRLLCSIPVSNNLKPFSDSLNYTDNNFDYYNELQKEDVSFIDLSFENQYNDTELI